MKNKMTNEILRIEFASKKINGVNVLKNVSLNIFEGEIVKLFGDEGQSKAMLVRLLGGLLIPDSGRVLIGNKEVAISSPYDAKRLGISIINKRSDLLPNLTVMENLFLGRRDETFGLFFSRKKQYERSKELLDILGLDISPDTMANELSQEQIQLLQLEKALLDNPKLVIMDHTHILLDNKQIKLFEGVFKELSKRKVGVLIVAQNLKDFSSISDRTYIMKDGSIIGHIKSSELEKEKIVNMITKDYFVNTAKVPLDSASKEVLRIENLFTDKSLSDVSFSVKKGEILSITGSYGSGKCEIGYTLAGMQKIKGGEIFLEDQRIKIRNPKDAVKNKISLISYENDEVGLLTNLSLKENVTIPRLKSISKFSVIKDALEDCLVDELSRDLGFEFENKDADISQLSPADLRKVGIARAVSINPKVLILIDATKGLNAQAKKQILELLLSLAQRGMSIILISSNVYEMLQISDRVLIFGENVITGEINKDELKYGEFMY